MKLAPTASPRAMLAFAVVALATSFGAACTSPGPRDGNGPSPIAFAPAAPLEGATVALRGRVDPLVPGRVAFDVVARGAGDVHGAAFRVSWDPAAMVFVEATSGASWSKTALALAKEGAPGQLAVAWTEKGERSIDATAETVLGTLIFDAKSHASTTLAFTTERSQVVDKKGRRIAAQWLDESLTSTR